jgi:hypothetical protein
MSGMEIIMDRGSFPTVCTPKAQAQLCRDYHSVVCAPVHLSLNMLLCAGTNGNLKRLGKFLEGSSCKKQAGAPRTDDIIHAQIQNDAASSTEYEDHMDLD